MTNRQKKIFILTLLLLIASCYGNKTNKTKSNLEDSEKILFEYSRSSDPKSLDPQAQFDETSGTFINSVYDTLMSYHYLKRPYKLEPTLLKDHPKVSEDGKTISFELRKGVYFHDDPCFPEGKGKELTSDDVLYTLKRFADININTQSWFLLDNVITGLDKFREKTEKQTKIDYDSFDISGLKKVDRYRFTIQLKQRNPLILYSLAASSLSIVAKEAVEKYGRAFSRHPVGTGAFTLKKYRKKQMMTLVKNQNYFLTYPSTGEENDKKNGLLKDADKKLPLVDEINIHYIPESQPEMLKFKKGELAWVALDRDNFKQMAYFDKSGDIHLNKDADETFDLYTEPGLSTSYLVFNLKDPVVKTKYLRKAIAHAIDFNKKIQLLSNGRGVKLYSMVPPSIPGSEKDIGKYGIDYNLKEARSYLEKAGYPEGKGLKEITLTLSGSSTSHQNYYEFMRNSLASIGIKLKPDYKTWPSFLKATEIGDFQIAASAWAADYPDPENFYQLLYGPNKPPGQNSSSFDHPEYNRLYEKMRFMTNTKERFEIIKKMALILQEEVPVIVDSTPLVSGLIQEWVLNFKRNIMLGRPFKYFNLESLKKPL